MGDYRVDRDDIGASKILSEKQRRWLDGDKDALSYRDREIWSRIRNRYRSAYTELAFIEEWLPRSQEAKALRDARLPDNSPTPRFSEEKAESLAGAAHALAGTVGVDEQVEMIAENLTAAEDSDQPGVDMVANIISDVLEGESTELETWEAFSEAVDRKMRE